MFDFAASLVRREMQPGNCNDWQDADSGFKQGLFHQIY
jgi:hypothetical protein